MVREIPLSQGYVALVDDEDHERIARHKWSARVTRRKHFPDVVYAYRTVVVDGKRVPEHMHQVILGCTGMIDHVDDDGLNNQKSNLRPATREQNQGRKRHGIPRKHTDYRGVCFRPKQRSKPWDAQIGFNDRNLWLGSFATPEEAARAYDAKAKELHGEFARLNFPERSAA